MRDLIYPQMKSADLLRQYLEEARWDVEQAHAQWNADRGFILAGRTAETSSASSFTSDSDNDADDEDEDNNAAGASSPTTPNNSLRQVMEDDNLPFNSNVEKERRDAALAFRLRIEEIHSLTLSISEAVLLLYLTEWDLGAASASFTSHVEARNQLRVAFDGMRERTNDVDEQTARIAALVDLTERADWLSMKLFLERRDGTLLP
jgi:hypothetical protein